MQLIGVVDLKAGRAVRARGGARARYAPLDATGGVAIDGDPLALARAYVIAFGLTSVYAADLDAIAGGEVDEEVLGALAAIAPLWVDAGISSVERARRVVACGAAKTISRRSPPRLAATAWPSASTFTPVLRLPIFSTRPPKTLRRAQSMPAQTC
jgi:uncharacterized protein related to proFAR isomerase